MPVAKPKSPCHWRPGTQSGFTLVELIIGIIVFGIAMTFVTSLVVPLASRSADPIMQVRASELASSFLDEISAKAFDENSTSSVRCNDDLNNDGDLQDMSEVACTVSGNLGPDTGESRLVGLSNFDDVDDYHGLHQGVGATDPVIRNSLGEPLSIGGENVYNGFSVAISVVYDGNYDGAADNNQTAKRITVVVTTPFQESLVFSTYRSNY